MTQPKEYYEKKPGFVVKSGVEGSEGEIIDYAVITDESQGFKYTKDGLKLDLTNGTSYEVCGDKTNEKEPAKIIVAKNGNIIFDAENGEIVLRARSIRIVAYDASGEVTIDANKQVSIKSPVQSMNGTNINILGSNSVSVAGNAVDTVGGMQNTQGVLTDALQGSFLGGVLQVLSKFKKFLEL